MKVINLKSLARTYKNNGQHAEQVARYTLTGEVCKADNISHEKSADCLNIQIKSARATVCYGDSLAAYLEKDAATAFGYVISDFSKMFIMDKAEYIDFVEKFGTLTKDSTKNGGRVKIRLKTESSAMIEYLNKNSI